MADEIDDSVALQDRHIRQSIARITGRRPREIQIPPPRYQTEDEKGTNNGDR